MFKKKSNATVDSRDNEEVLFMRLIKESKFSKKQLSNLWGLADVFIHKIVNGKLEMFELRDLTQMRKQLEVKMGIRDSIYNPKNIVAVEEIDMLDDL